MCNYLKVATLYTYQEIVDNFACVQFIVSAESIVSEHLKMSSPLLTG